LGAVFMFSAAVTAFFDRSIWEPTVMMGVLVVAEMAWFISTRLILTDSEIYYRSLFIRTQVPLAKVVAAKFEIGFVAFSYKPYQRVVLTIQDESGNKKDITINAGLLDRDQVRRWVADVKSRLKR